MIQIKYVCKQIHVYNMYQFLVVVFICKYWEFECETQTIKFAVEAHKLETPFVVIKKKKLITDQYKQYDMIEYTLLIAANEYM